MAEAHSAVSFQLSLSQDGALSYYYDKEVLKLIFEAHKRLWKKRFARLINTIKNGIFPISQDIFVGNVILLTGLHLFDMDWFTFGIVPAIFSGLNLTGFTWVISCLVSGILTSLIGIALLRFLLRILFQYQSWMYLHRDQLKNPPKLMKLWFGIVKLVTSLRVIGVISKKTGKPMLYSYQRALPALPLPSVKATVRRYLRNAKAVLNVKEYLEVERMSKTFSKTIAPRLQNYLWLKWFTSANYVSDWWEEYVYLRGRSPIMINSNYYIMDNVWKRPTNNQAARAANAVYAAFNFRRILLKQETPPVMVNGFIPMCSNQYVRMFNTTRIPGTETDTLQTAPDSTHVVILSRGRFYRLGCYNEGKLISPRELQRHIQAILDDPKGPEDGEELLAVMTASDRTDWARVRERMIAKGGQNWNSLSTIESAAFVVSLDEEEYDSDPKKAYEFGKALLGGNGSNRWFDKSINIVVSKNAFLGVNCEHSWADAPVCGHFWEYVLVADVRYIGYDKNGNSKDITSISNSNGDSDNEGDSGPSNGSKVSSRLRWTLNEDIRRSFDTCMKDARKLIDDVDLMILDHDKFGKGSIKKCKVSPDAFIQMALQLAYRRDQGRFCQTYEASMTRLFSEGRTETVRPCTLEAVAFVNSMDDPNIDKEEKAALLQIASGQHQKGYQDCMTGKGVDRHLFCLYVVSKYLEVDSPFLKKILSEPWRLSTSQTPVRGEYFNVNKDSETLGTPGGGFGPVADDGYGVAYLVMGEDNLFFHISSKNSCQGTSSERFGREIEKAMSDILALHV